MFILSPFTYYQLPHAKQALAKKRDYNEECNGLNALFPENSYVEALISNMTEFGEGSN